MGMSEARSFAGPLRRQPMTATAREGIGTAMVRARQSFMRTMFSLGLCLDVLSIAPPPHAGNELMSSTARTHNQQKALSVQEVRDVLSTYGSCLTPTRYDGTALLLGKIHAISTAHWEKCDAKLSDGCNRTDCSNDQRLSSHDIRTAHPDLEPCQEIQRILKDFYKDTSSRLDRQIDAILSWEGPASDL